MELMLLRIVLFTLIILMLGGFAVVIIMNGIRKKKKAQWIPGLLFLPIAFAGMFILITNEVQDFVGQKAEWRSLFNPNNEKIVLKKDTPLDSALLQAWPSTMAVFTGRQKSTDSIICYILPNPEENMPIINRIMGGYTKNDDEASFRLDLTLREAFKGDLILESRNKEGELISRNAVYIYEKSPAEMSIEFRLKDFTPKSDLYLLLNFNTYE